MGVRTSAVKHLEFVARGDFSVANRRECGKGPVYAIYPLALEEHFFGTQGGLAGAQSACSLSRARWHVSTSRWSLCRELLDLGDQPP